jgi:hypothetical protein
MLALNITLISKTPIERDMGYYNDSSLVLTKWLSAITTLLTLREIRLGRQDDPNTAANETMLSSPSPT